VSGGAALGRLLDRIEEGWRYYLGAIAVLFGAGVALDLVASTWAVVPHVLSLGLSILLLARLRAALEREAALARTDPLTGAANVRTFHEAAALEIERSRRTDRPFTIAYVDLDDFKRVNDRSGHLVGDQVLRTVVRALRENVRATDTVARLGGDEFAVLLPETDTPAADAVVEKIRRVFADEMRRGDWPVTFSIGVATYRTPPADTDEMIRKADEFMYLVKRGGKNDVHHEVV
jgi:diguanylate cyclase (GGDEF)-like protein